MNGRDQISGAGCQGSNLIKLVLLIPETRSLQPVLQTA